MTKLNLNDSMLVVEEFRLDPKCHIKVTMKGNEKYMTIPSYETQLKKQKFV